MNFPDSNLLSARVPVEHLPPSPPPPPAPTVTTTTSTPIGGGGGAPPPAAPPPPPPPPPSDQMNGLRITNGDLKNNILVCALHLKISIPETEFIYLFSCVFFYVKTKHEFDFIINCLFTLFRMESRLRLPKPMEQVLRK